MLVVLYTIVVHTILKCKHQGFNYSVGLKYYRNTSQRERNFEKHNLPQISNCPEFRRFHHASECSQKVVFDGRVPVLSGVAQGSVLGPVLFLIFINDLPDNIRSSVRLFADDCVLYRNIKSPLDCHILQDDLNSLAKWEMDWQMKFNVSKCHSMRVTRLHPSNHIQFNYCISKH